MAYTQFLRHLDPGGDPRPPETAEPVAWKCESCRKWIPVGYSSHVILVDDVDTRWSGRQGVKGLSRFLRRMVVCAACRRSIGGG